MSSIGCARYLVLLSGISNTLVARRLSRPPFSVGQGIESQGTLLFNCHFHKILQSAKVKEFSRRFQLLEWDRSWYSADYWRLKLPLKRTSPKLEIPKFRIFEKLLFSIFFNIANREVTIKKKKANCEVHKVLYQKKLIIQRLSVVEHLCS